MFDWLKTYDTYYIKTPNNSDVTCYSFRKDYKETVIDDMNETIENNYGQYVEVIGTSTRKYNCHSYALYSQDVNNNYYWINDPSPFYEDGSYCEVLDGQIKEGDIICYINPNNPNCKYLHSGIVTYVPDKYVYDENMINLENILVTSKWADHCLVEHSVVNCPYYPNDIFVEDTNSYSVASNVKFYRLHNNDLEYSVDDNNHNLVCTGCKKIYSSSNHSNQIEESNNIESNICTICDKMNYIKTENFHCRSTIDNYSFLLYKNQTISYEINITCNNYYYFECESTQEINFKLYDQYNNLVSDSLYITTNYGYKYWITATLEEGKYYIQFENHTQNT